MEMNLNFMKSHPIDQAGRMEATNNGYFFKN